MKRNGIIRFSFILFNFLFILFLGINLYFPDKAMDLFKFRPYIIVSDSMSPIIEIGDIVVLRAVDPKNLVEGDIISFQWDHRTVIHFVAQIEEDGSQGRSFRTKNARAHESAQWDYWTLGEEHITGVLAFKIPKVGFLGLFLRSFQGMISVVVLAAVFLLRKMVIKYYETD
ncbi:MAG: signal peptidase I [Tissierellia bacterium]|nr:signal peptidase I [Tissierellia bacterium]